MYNYSLKDDRLSGSLSDIYKLLGEEAGYVFRYFGREGASTVDSLPEVIDVLKKTNIKEKKLIQEVLLNSEKQNQIVKYKVIKNYLNDAEFNFACEIVNNEGGIFLGQEIKMLQGIDGYLYSHGSKVPISLKELTTNNLKHIIIVINDNIKYIINNTDIIRKPDIYIKLKNYSYETIKEFAENGPLIRIPKEGVVRGIIFYTTNGIYKIP